METKMRKHTIGWATRCWPFKVLHMRVESWLRYCYHGQGDEGYCLDSHQWAKP